MTTATAIPVPSFTHPGVAYQTSRESCTCKAFEFGHARDVSYRCKHQLRAFPAPRLCEHCHIDIARQSSCYCSDRCQRASLQAACRHDWTDAGSCDFACTKCGATYSYETDAPLLVSQTRPMFVDSASPAVWAHCLTCQAVYACGDDDTVLTCPACRADADPVHARHLALTQRMRDEANIDRCLALVTGQTRLTIEADPLADLFG